MARPKETKYLNKIYKNKYNTELKVIEYLNYKNVKVLDLVHNVEINTDIQKLELGYVISPLDKSIFDKGYFGVGEYKRDNHSKCYSSWYNMLFRCYSYEYKIKYPTYQNVNVCEEWHNYQNFAKWFENNYYEVDRQRMELDKDILIKGNKLYSPETCCFVPRRINSLLINNKNVRGQYLLGVDYHEGKFRARCETLNGSKFLGNYNTEIEAFNSYKKFKEGYIKIIAEEYKDLIPQNLYEALYRYEVDMED